MDHEELNQEAFDLDEIKHLIDMDEAANSAENEEPEEPAAQEAVPADPDSKNHEPEKQKNIVLYLHDLVYLMAGIVLVFLLCFRIVIVSGDSMYSTLVDGDYLLLLSNVFYHDPQYGDIIVASKSAYEDGTPIIKRIIATEGQEVDIDFEKGIVYVDGQALQEDYTYTLTTMDEGVSFPLTVEEGCVFVLGDNRGRSKDSRNPEIGLIDTREIVGKAIMLIFPGTDKGGSAPQYDRIGVIS